MSSLYQDNGQESARLLVVDDEESVALTISEVLRLEGFEVDVASSGGDAAERLSHQSYDLVLTDLHMDGGDGLSVLEEIRRGTPLTIAIVLTGFASVESAIAALRQGAYDYLVKPCIIDELKLTVRRGLEHRRLMIAEQEARASLEQLNEELERRVEERTAELLRLNGELSEANRAKDIFLATLSHELRTPLTPVLGWVNLLRSGGTNLDTSLVAQGLDAIERNARLQARLIDDLLDISRIISGKLRLEWEPVNLCAIIEVSVETVRGTASARNITIEVEPCNQLLIVQGASVRLQQVIWNLLTNAIKFSPDGGSVSMRAFRQGREACVVVTDAGIGIEPEFLPHVFDRFRQADGSTTRQHGGLGLGLAIVQALVELHGGWVRAESDGEGQGARFSFGIPLAPTGSEDELSEDDVETTKTGARPVLVVEDSPEMLELLNIMFERKGYRVLAADTAAEAIKLAAGQTPGIIISDINMPDLDGYQLLSQLRRLPGLDKVPAIALSGYAMDEDRARSLAAGFSLHLAKPIDPDQLFAAIKQLTA